MANFGFEIDVPSTGEEVARRIVGVVFYIVAENEFGTGSGALAKLRLDDSRVLL